MATLQYTVHVELSDVVSTLLITRVKKREYNSSRLNIRLLARKSLRAYCRLKTQDMKFQNLRERAMHLTQSEINELYVKFDDVTEQVKSDLAKGDDHSTPLLGGTDQIFWEQN